MSKTYTEVLKDSNGNLIQGALVSLYLDGVRIDVDSTSKDGRFTFTGLTTNYYELRFKGRGFTSDDTRYISIVDDIDTDSLKPEIRLERLLAQFNAITWASRAILIAAVDDDLVSSSNTMVARDFLIRPPAVTESNTAYIFETSSVDVNVSGITKAVVTADFNLTGDAKFKLETDFTGAGNWFTWLDTADTTVIGNGNLFPNGYRDLRDIEVTTSGVIAEYTVSGVSYIAGFTGFVEGETPVIKATLTTDILNQGGYLTSLAVFTNPNLVDPQTT